MFDILRNYKTVFHSDYIILYSHQQNKVSNFSISLQHLSLPVLSDYSHPSGCEIASHCGYDLHFSDN